MVYLSNFKASGTSVFFTRNNLIFVKYSDIYRSAIIRYTTVCLGVFFSDSIQEKTVMRKTSDKKETTAIIRKVLFPAVLGILLSLSLTTVVSAASQTKYFIDTPIQPSIRYGYVTGKPEYAVAAAGTPITLRAKPFDGYRFIKWEVIYGDIVLSDVTNFEASFTMPNEDVCLCAYFDRIGGNGWDGETYGGDGSSGRHSSSYSRGHATNDDEDHSHSDDGSSDSPSGSTWVAPAPVETPEQQSAKQHALIHSSLTALNAMGAGKTVFATVGMPLNMTYITTLNADTTKLLVANNGIPYNVTITFGGRPLVVRIPANFNYSSFVKPDGTLNIHEVLWAVLSKRP